MANDYTHRRVKGDALINVLDDNLTFSIFNILPCPGTSRFALDYEGTEIVTAEGLFTNSSGEVGGPTAYDETNGLAYFTSFDRITKYNTVTGAIVATVSTGQGGSHSIKLNADGSRLYVVSAGDGDIKWIDTAAFTVNAAVPVGTKPLVTYNDIAIAADGTVYVACEDEIIARYNAALVLQTDAFPIGSTAGNFAKVVISPDGAWLAAQAADGDITVFDLSDDSIAFSDTAPVSYSGLEFDSTSTNLYYGAQDEFHRVDTATWTTNDISTVIDIGPYSDTRLLTFKLLTDTRALFYYATNFVSGSCPHFVDLVVDINGGSAARVPQSRSYLGDGIWGRQDDFLFRAKNVEVLDRSVLVDRTLTGTVLVDSVAAARRVIAYDKATMLPVTETTSDAGDGSYSLYVQTPDDITVIAVGSGTELTQMFDLVDGDA